jgi:hypothetical protein
LCLVWIYLQSFLKAFTRFLSHTCFREASPQAGQSLAVFRIEA